MYVAVPELLFNTRADCTALSAFTAEASLLAGLNIQPTIPAHYFHGPGAFGRMLRLRFAGVVGSTGTPTYTFQLRANTAVGPSNLAGDSLAVSAAITTQAGITNQNWFAEFILQCQTPMQGDNATVLCTGSIRSPGGFAAPYEYAMTPSAPPTATWTATIDSSVAHYINFSVTCSANNASNTITCKHAEMVGWN